MKMEMEISKELYYLENVFIFILKRKFVEIIIYNYVH